MILHWLTGYSFAQLLMLAGGPIIFLGAAIMLFGALNGKGYSLWGSFAGLLMGACMTGANLLRGQARWQGLVDNISMIGGVSSIVYAVSIIVHRKRKRVAMSPPLPHALPSDKVWPPPPTSPGG